MKPESKPAAPNPQADPSSLKPQPERTKPNGKDGRRVSVALGGGGGRGISHLGVLQAISESGWQIDRICGVSIGAIAGAMFATKGGSSEAQDEVLAFIGSPKFQQRQKEMLGARPAGGQGAARRSRLARLKGLLKAPKSLTRALRHAAVLPHTLLEHVVETLLPDVNIEDLPVPMSVVAVDLKTGNRVELESGPLRRAVRASASIPGVFPPVPWQDMLLSDIGVYESVPVATAKSKASDLTMAVDVSEDTSTIDGFRNVLEVFSRVQHLAERELRRYRLNQADLIVRPEIGRRPWFDFSQPEEMIRLGYQATKDKIRTVSEPIVPAVVIGGSNISIPQSMA